MSEEEEEEEEFEEEEPEPSPPEQPRLDVRRALELRSAGTAISIKEKEYLPDQKVLILSMPNGKETRDFLLPTYRTKDILDVPFEKYVILGQYDAIASYSGGTIECSIRAIDNRSTSFLYRKLFGTELSHLRQVAAIEIPSGAGIKIFISSRSDDFAAFFPFPSRQITIRISGLQISQHDQSLALLERIAGSLFFQIDVITGVPLTLVRRRVRKPLRRSGTDPAELRFPTTEYDAAPLSLYWYARAAVGMPLLQFLAYYQVIEFYFPMYSQAEAQRRIQQILKDPGFRPERDADVNRILSAARISASGSFGDERAQLRATINECLDASALRAFLTLDDERRTFFAAKAKGLTSVRLPIENPNLDLRNDAAERIYNIRCKIVHTKSGGRDGDVELLLPFSREAEMLYHDVELLAFIATRALIAASSPLGLA